MRDEKSQTFAVAFQFGGAFQIEQKFAYDDGGINWDE